MLKDVLHVTDMGFSLVSVIQLTNRGHKVIFIGGRVNILSGNKLIACGTKDRGLYSLDTLSSPTQDVIHAVACTASLQLWHKRMGHVHHSGIRQMATKNAMHRPRITGPAAKHAPCEGCIMGRLPRLAIPKASKTKYTRLLGIVHTDIAGALPAPSKGCALYYVTFIDDLSRWVTVYPLGAKSDCL